MHFKKQIAQHHSTVMFAKITLISRNSHKSWFSLTSLTCCSAHQYKSHKSLWWTAQPLLWGLVVPLFQFFQETNLLIFKSDKTATKQWTYFGGTGGLFVCLGVLFVLFCLVMQHSTSFGQLCPGNFLYLHRNHHLPYPAIQKVLSLTLNTSYFCAWLLPRCFPVMPLPRDPAVCNTTPFASTSNSQRKHYVWNQRSVFKRKPF